MATPPIVDGAVHWAFASRAAARRRGLPVQGRVRHRHDDGSREAACARDVVCAVVRGARVMDPNHPATDGRGLGCGHAVPTPAHVRLGQAAEYGMRQRNDACYHQLRVDGGPAAWV